MTATQSIIKVTEQSACFGHGGVTAFTERRVTGVLKGYNVLFPALNSMYLDLFTFKDSLFTLSHSSIPHNSLFKDRHPSGKLIQNNLLTILVWFTF